MRGGPKIESCHSPIDGDSQIIFSHLELLRYGGLKVSYLLGSDLLGIILGKIL